ncbi:unnamed protein product [Rotaria sordida]|uniref:Uncharacterized protein n=1 Tax=Rotaria sordida TaxID=392033 RepID=A0A814MXY9_9BILA|nr:unnamed protein product [Rotaria sordida]CAF1276785.1 unnamed protein product [Rotaria sordida]
MKYTDKVMIPKEDHPDGHFFGLIIGRGSKTFKMLEKEKLNLINEAEKIVTNTIIFTIFSGPDHLTIDCKFRKKRNNTHIELNPDGSLTINGNRQKQQKLYCQNFYFYIFWYQSLINELMDDQRNLMTGYKTTGPTLAIIDETSSSITDSNTTITTLRIKSFNQYEQELCGIFKYVRQVELYDQRPFQHEFFLRIAKLFPLMEELIMHNEQRQINKQFRKSRLTNH